MKRLPFLCGGQWEAVLFSPIRLLQEKVTPSPIPTFGEPGKPAPSPTLPGTRVPHAGSRQAWSPRAGQVAFTLSWPTLQGGALIAGPICPLVPHPEARTPESQASEHSPCGQKSLACGAAIPSISPAPQHLSIPSNMQKGEERKGRHSPGSQQQPGGERETGRQQGQKVLLNLYPSLTKQGKSSKIP